MMLRGMIWISPGCRNTHNHNTSTNKLLATHHNSHSLGATVHYETFLKSCQNTFVPDKGGGGKLYENFFILNKYEMFSPPQKNIIHLNYSNKIEHSPAVE